jgi:transposase-like protein
MTELGNYFCPNPECKDHRIRDRENIRTSTRYGKNRTHLLPCKTCNQRFSENRNIVFMHSNYSREIIQRIILAVAECSSIQGTARILSQDKDGVNRIVPKAGEHCRQILRNLIQGLCLNEWQMDELWTFVKKKKSLSGEDFEEEYGLRWIWTALDPESKLITNFFIGQKTFLRLQDLYRRPS